jgi:hypothetical protein
MNKSREYPENPVSVSLLKQDTLIKQEDPESILKVVLSLAGLSDLFHFSGKSNKKKVKCTGQNYNYRACLGSNSIG